MAEKTPRRSPRAAHRVIEGKGIVVVIDRRELHRLNAVGTRVWDLCDGRGVPAIVESIVAEFDVDEARARVDVQRFLDRLTEVGAVQWVEA